MDREPESALLSLDDEPSTEEAGPVLDEPGDMLLGDEPSDDEPTDSQLNAAKLVASAFKKGDPALIHKALKLHYDTCQTFE